MQKICRTALKINIFFLAPGFPAITASKKLEHRGVNRG